MIKTYRKTSPLFLKNKISFSFFSGAIESNLVFRLFLVFKTCRGYVVGKISFASAGTFEKNRFFGRARTMPNFKNKFLTVPTLGEVRGVGRTRPGTHAAGRTRSSEFPVENICPLLSQCHFPHPEIRQRDTDPLFPKIHQVCNQCPILPNPTINPRIHFCRLSVYSN